MYVIRSLKCKSCSEWLPPLPDVLGNSPSLQLECPGCAHRRTYTRNDFLQRFVPGEATDAPLYKRVFRWHRVRGCGLDFFMFVSETDAGAKAMQSVASSLLGLC